LLESLIRDSTHPETHCSCFRAWKSRLYARLFPFAEMGLSPSASLPNTTLHLPNLYNTSIYIQHNHLRMSTVGMLK
jgi:hypothetical protein